jgi:hypothetical protein
MHPGSLFLGFSLFEFSCSSNTGFEERRKERAEMFVGKRKQEDEEDDTSSDNKREEDAGAEDNNPVTDNLPPSNKRSIEFIPFRKNIVYVCKHIRSHDLCFLFDVVFPQIPASHIYDCLKIIWQMTYRLANNPPPRSCRCPSSTYRRSRNT